MSDLQPLSGWRRVPAWVWAVLIALTVLAVRSTVEQWQSYGRAVALENQGELVEAVAEYRWTLRWYTPWGPVHDDAAEALVEIAKRAERDKPRLAMEALDALRSGLIASRSFYQPRADLVAHVNKTIAPILVRVAEREGDKRDKDKLLSRFEADYARPVGIASWASLAVSLGFVLWLFGLVMAIRDGVGEDGRWRRQGWRWVGASVAGFACWALAMWCA